METFGNKLPKKTPKEDNISLYCSLCCYYARDKYNYKRHIESKKHKSLENEKWKLLEIKNPLVLPIKSHCFECKKCDFYTDNKKDYKRHLMTRKHLNPSFFEKIPRFTPNSKKSEGDDNNTTKHHLCDICGARYKSKSGLWKHRQKCKSQNATVNGINENTINTMMEYMSKEILPINQTNYINNHVTNSNSTANFNINIFLNEHCKNAMNINDFIENMKVSFEEIDYSCKGGLANGISKIFVESLKVLDVTERPIHCTDSKRETLYIKYNDEWKKDSDKKQIEKCITKVTDNAIQKWVSDNPDWCNNEVKQSTYIDLCEAIVCNKNDNLNKRIIKGIAKETKIDKSLVPSF